MLTVDFFRRRSSGVEQRIRNAWVGGSNPFDGTISLEKLIIAVPYQTLLTGFAIRRLVQLCPWLRWWGGSASKSFSNLPMGRVGNGLYKSRNGKLGRISAFSKRRLTFWAWVGVYRASWFSCHSNATALKVFSALRTASRFSSCFAPDGSIPCTKSFLARSRPPQASASETIGYAPREIRFSLPKNLYFKRQSLLPLGITSRNNPPPSKSL